MIARVVDGWNHFWFESFEGRRWRWFRFLICTNMVATYVVRQFSLDLYFSPTRGMPILEPSNFMTMAWRWSILGWIHSDSVFAAVHAGYVAILALLALGAGGRVLGRLLGLAAFMLHVSFIHANIGAVYGVDLIFTFFLFFFVLVDDRARQGTLASWLASTGYRMAQIQLCVIYGFSGLEKLKGALWWKGEAIWNVVGNPQLARFDFTWLSYLPVVLVLVAYLTLFWEVYFPALVWVPRLRVPMLLLGVGFHLSIAAMMNIFFFGLIMITTYVLFLKVEEVQWLEAQAKSLLGRRVASSWAFRNLLQKSS